MIDNRRLREFDIPSLMDSLALMRASPLFEKEQWVRKGYDEVVTELKLRPQEDLVQYMLSLLDD